MQRFLGRLLVIAIGCAVLGCAPTQDGGADLVRSFFGDLEAHRFEVAADLVREADGAPLSASKRDRFVRGWRKAYEGYDIRFTNVVVQRYPESPGVQVPAADLHTLGALSGRGPQDRTSGTNRPRPSPRAPH